jgi:short chain dehydrogenase
MQTFEQKRVLIIGGSRGLGLGVVEALVAHHAGVTVMARDTASLASLRDRLGVSIIAGDATDGALAESVVRDVSPLVLVLNAGATPTMAPLHEQTWESFSKNWNTDVKATFCWIQAALRVPLEKGSRVLLSSSGAAPEGSPLSGSYAGAKRMIWLMAGYANSVGGHSRSGHSISGVAGATDRGRDRTRPRRRSLRAPQRCEYRSVPGRVRQSPRPTRLRGARRDTAQRTPVRESDGVRYSRRYRNSAA